MKLEPKYGEFWRFLIFDDSIILEKIIEPRLLENIRIFEYSNIRIGNSIQDTK